MANINQQEQRLLNINTSALWKKRENVSNDMHSFNWKVNFIAKVIVQDTDFLNIAIELSDEDQKRILKDRVKSLCVREVFH